MSSATLASKAASARRQVLRSLYTSLGLDATPLPMRRTGKPSARTRIAAAPLSASETQATSPPSAVCWLTRATFGFSQSDLTAFNALGSSDSARWTTWVSHQIALSDNDSACNSRIASANFQSLNLSANQLWTTYHADTTNYNHRMLPIAESECATLIRQIYSKHQLFETMVDFWHDHFSVNGWDYDGGPIFPAFDALFRNTASGNGVFGNFKTLLQAVGESASMMFMLDLYSSVAAGPNENYARELCELHTLGAENYAGVIDPDPYTNAYDLPTGTAADGHPIRLQYVDNDVYAATTALTGWTLSDSFWQTQSDPNPGVFEYRDDLHYNKAPTTFLNRAIGANTHQTAGQDVYDWLAGHPGVAHFIATKMCRRLVSDNPPPSLVSSVASVFLANYQAPNQLALVTQAILTSSEFLNSWGQKMKRPAVAMVSTLRALNADFTPTPDLDNTSYQSGDWTTTDATISAMQAAGHRLFYWPAPNGYPDTQTAWASTGALGMTLRMLAQLVETTKDRTTPGTAFIVDVQAQTLAALSTANRTSANIANYWCTQILGYVPANVYNAAVNFMRQNAAPTDVLDLTTDSSGTPPPRVGVWNGSNLSKHYTIARLRSMVSLILSSPDFLTR